MEEKELKEEKEEKSEEKQNEEKEKEKEKEEDEDEDDISVIIGDQEGGIHQVPLLVAASMTEVWKQVDQQNNPSSTTIQMGMTKEILMHVLLYQRCCVCHHVKVLEEIKNAREILESKVKEDPNFAQSMQDAALAVASDSLTLFLECCNNLASFETLPEIESKDRTDAFSRQAERAKAKKTFFYDFAATVHGGRRNYENC
uniref:Uncharacterized protein n=1 Tax=Paramoeba aestuarina TaxID=180227 RepID=A0A7S4JRD3_9EUKA|mmetsp:Transcript_12535/g.19187  ORF Transcript_12535/g.19187 Transcript_12535/m.19187 type:complete len:200 (+) Transcript_12535:299-898(+)